jgi:Peptidase S46.
LKFANSNGSKTELSLLEELLDLIDESLNENLARRYYGNSTLISMAQRIYRNAVEQGKPDQERKHGYQERDQERIRNGIKRMDYSFDSRVHKAIFLDRLSSYSKFDAKLRRPDYSKNLLLDDNFELTKKKSFRIIFLKIHNS